MKEYKGKFTTKLFWTVCGFCAGWFVCGVLNGIIHNIFISFIVGILVILFMLYKIYFLDNFSILLSENELSLKRFNKKIKTIDIQKYFWSEYSKYSNTKNAEDQDIYYIDKETNEEESIDLTNFSDDDYNEILTKLGAKNQNIEPVKIETIKK